MSEYVELAYAAATSRLCLFTGTGFSKAVSNGEAPTWKRTIKKSLQQSSQRQTVGRHVIP